MNRTRIQGRSCLSQCALVVVSKRCSSSSSDPSTPSSSNSSSSSPSECWSVSVFSMQASIAPRMTSFGNGLSMVEFYGNFSELQGQFPRKDPLRTDSTRLGRGIGAHARPRVDLPRRSLHRSRRKRTSIASSKEARWHCESGSSTQGPGRRAHGLAEIKDGFVADSAEQLPEDREAFIKQ